MNICERQLIGRMRRDSVGRFHYPIGPCQSRSNGLWPCCRLNGRLRGSWSTKSAWGNWPVPCSLVFGVVNLLSRGSLCYHVGAFSFCEDLGGSGIAARSAPPPRAFLCLLAPLDVIRPAVIVPPAQESRVRVANWFWRVLYRAAARLQQLGPFPDSLRPVLEPGQQSFLGASRRYPG